MLSDSARPNFRLDKNAAKAVTSVRAGLSKEFEPRSIRALKDWPVTTRRKVLGGLSCHIVEPADKPAKILILHFYGGGYVSGKPEYDLPITAALAALCDAIVIAPRYAQAPERPYPQAFNQGVCLYRTLTHEYAPLPVVLTGESAGGGLAAAVALAAIGAKMPLPACLSLFSPWVDLSKSGIAQTATGEDPTLKTEQLAWYAEAYLAGANAKGPYVSPALARIPQEWPSTLLTTATGDLLHPTILTFRDRLKNHGADVRLIEADGMCHVFELYDEFDEAAPALRETAAFIKAAVDSEHSQSIRET